ncbi:MAG: hypothetical protein GX771_11325 [Halomonadaceae bacterium]|nr:hypothetical protein [Halomonadaceae bacterium]
MLALALGVVMATGVHTLRGDAPSTMDSVSVKFLVQQFAREGYILEAVKEVPRLDLVAGDAVVEHGVRGTSAPHPLGRGQVADHRLAGADGRVE